VHKAVIAGTGKMHMTCAQPGAYAQRVFAPLVAHIPGDRDLVLAPPFNQRSRRQPGALRRGVKLSSQNVHWTAAGPTR